VILVRFTLPFASSTKKNANLLWKKVNEDVSLVLLSLMVQIPLAIFLGDYYDERLFMVTGYFVGSGLNPYQPHAITGIFSNPLFQGTIPTFGYPPPWALVLGLAFQAYRVIPNLFLYNFAIKVPVIAANICLAFLVRHIILEMNAAKKRAQFAFLFLLLNPFTLLTTSAWGQIDSVIALLCVISLYLLSKGRKGWCALPLALAFSAKPIMLPLLGLPLLFHEPQKRWGNLKFLAILIGMTFAFFVLPFLIFGWQPLLTPGGWSAHFQAAGGLSLFSLVETINDTLVLPSSLEALGFLWVPALLIGYYGIYRNPPASQTDLTRKAVGLVLIFFLTRSWLSEPNINLILPLMLIVIGTEKTTFRNFHFAWVIPSAFMFLNYSIPSLFFLPYPAVISDLAALDTHIRTLRLAGKFLVAVLWQMFAWTYLFKMFRRKTNKKNSLALFRA
jgi:hypothetical protein